MLENKLIDFLRDVRRVLYKNTRLPAIGQVDLGSLDRVTPVSNVWGFDRGRPADRYYIEGFLADYRTDVHGRVLEVADNTYTVQFGGDRVSHSDILHDAPGHPRATLVADLSKVDQVPAARFDCVICTQTLHLIYDLSAAIQSLYKLLKPGAVLLLTVPGITAISREDMNRHGDYWRFTSAAVRKLFEARFDEADLRIKAYGNVYAATAFLHGLAVEELDQKKLDYFDRDYETLIAVRAEKPTEQT